MRQSYLLVEVFRFLRFFIDIGNHLVIADDYILILLIFMYAGHRLIPVNLVDWMNGLSFK